MSNSINCYSWTITITKQKQNNKIIVNYPDISSAFTSSTLSEGNQIIFLFVLYLYFTLSLQFVYNRSILIIIFSLFLIHLPNDVLLIKYTNLTLKPNETAAHITTTASMIFQNSRKYEPGCKMMPKSRIC